MSVDFFVTDGKNYNPQRVERIRKLRGNEDESLKTAPVQLKLF